VERGGGHVLLGVPILRLRRRRLDPLGLARIRFSTRLHRVSRAGGAGAGARRGVTGSGSGAELFVRAGGAVALAGISGVGRSGARGAGGGCRAAAAGTTVTGALTGGISDRLAGSVEAIRAGGVRRHWKERKAPSDGPRDPARLGT